MQYNVIITINLRTKPCKSVFMKKIVFYLFAFFSVQLVAQTDYYTKKGVVIEGYDVTSYFNGTPLKGTKQFSVTYDGAEFYFANEKNKKAFQANPNKYMPQYGGYCAYAVGLKSQKIKIDPETFEIRDGKLYLFYNSWGTNTLDLWNKKGAEQLQLKADENWKSINK